MLLFKFKKILGIWVFIHCPSKIRIKWCQQNVTKFGRNYLLELFSISLHISSKTFKDFSVILSTDDSIIHILSFKLDSVFPQIFDSQEVSLCPKISNRISQGMIKYRGTKNDFCNHIKKMLSSQIPKWYSSIVVLDIGASNSWCRSAIVLLVSLGNCPYYSQNEFCFDHKSKSGP